MSETLLLSVVVPVYNQADSILANVDTILERIGSGLGEPFELIVVSDGSVDRTQEQLLELRDERVRVFHYDRNLGKGYALKLGGLQARGQWIGFVDADLDLDLLRSRASCAAPSPDPWTSSSARSGTLTRSSNIRALAASRVGSTSSSVRLAFRLDVRRHAGRAEGVPARDRHEVLPLLLVKRFAFDLELLAVSRSLGFGRIEEQPIDLHYRFTGSGVGSIAVLRALVDTAAIFYRLRVLR